MSDDQRTDAATSGGDDGAGAPDTDAAGSASGTAAPGAEGPGGTYPAEKLDLGGGTSDGDTPAGNAGNAGNADG